MKKIYVISAILFNLLAGFGSTSFAMDAIDRAGKAYQGYKASLATSEANLAAANNALKNSSLTGAQRAAWAHNKSVAEQNIATYNRWMAQIEAMTYSNPNSAYFDLAPYLADALRKAIQE